MLKLYSLPPSSTRNFLSCQCHNAWWLVQPHLSRGSILTLHCLQYLGKGNSESACITRQADYCTLTEKKLGQGAAGHITEVNLYFILYRAKEHEWMLPVSSWGLRSCIWDTKSIKMGLGESDHWKITANFNVCSSLSLNLYSKWELQAL